jgi:membrane protease YdiL (CAAX protease family)
MLILIAAGFKRDQHPLPPFFTRQPWTYRDLLGVVAILTAITWVAFVPIVRAMTSTIQWVIVLSLQSIVVCFSISAVLKWKYRTALSAVGLRASGVYHLAWPLMIVSGSVAIVSLCIYFVFVMNSPVRTLGIPIPGSNLDHLLHQRPTMIAAVLVFYLDLVLLAPLAEELLFRGFAYSPLARKFGRGGGGILTAVLWSMFHYPEWRRMVFTFVAGLLYVYLYDRTKSLFPSLTFHATGNGLAVAAGILRELQGARTFALPIACAASIVCGLCGWIAWRRREKEVSRSGKSDP